MDGVIIQYESQEATTGAQLILEFVLADVYAFCGLVRLRFWNNGAA